MKNNLAPNFKPPTFLTDYYPFGYPIAERSWTGDGYRFGFNGQEKDDEIYGEGSAYPFKYRMYDSRLCRFWSVDPLASKYPYNSSYAFAENRVVDGREFEGLEVALIGKQIDASFVLSGSAHAGVAIIPNGVYGYGSAAIGIETNVSVASQIAVTYFPNMPLIQNATGWGFIGGASLNLGLIGTVFGNMAYSDGYWGINVSAGIGGGLLPVSGSAYGVYTKVIPLSDAAKKDYLNILYNTKDALSSKIKENNDQINNLNKANENIRQKLNENEKLSDSEKNDLIKTMNRNKSNISDMKKENKMNEKIIENIDNGINKLEK